MKPAILAAVLLLAACTENDPAPNAPGDGLVKLCANGGRIFRDHGQLFYRQRYDPWIDHADWLVSNTADLRQVCP